MSVAAGVYYRRLKPFLPGLEWAVAETPAMVAAMAHLPEPSFTTEPEGRFDLVLMSGSIQYMPDPYEALSRYAAMGEHVILTRCPLIDRDRLTVQRVPNGGSYPAWFLSEKRVLEALPGIIAQWEVPQDTVVLGGESVVYRGMLSQAATYQPEKITSVAAASPAAVI